MSCEKHALGIPGYSLEELAIKLGDLRYDRLDMFLQLLSDKLLDDAAADAERDRPKLCYQLYKAGAKVAWAGYHISNAWYYSKPHMDIKQDNA